MATTMRSRYIRKPRSNSSHGHNHVEFPSTNIVRNVPGPPKSLATIEEGNPSGPIRTGHNQHTHTGTLANLRHNSRFLVFIRYPEPQLKGTHSGPQAIECHMLNRYPEPQLKDTFRAKTLRTSTSPHRDILRSLIDHTLQFPLHPINIAITHALKVSRHPHSVKIYSFV
ncbi:hypothetical protein DEO72_LG1g2993 [Vigna unguiculata]|uniref:Uncharacterized protein n=1 Tax=Vigna unguiculata TaxID=3917 RepID=A0A4D6KZ80_VIGUN|nr:hypothetical protein DEO72_LG1g2993 [Vigna unguiculata]